MRVIVDENAWHDLEAIADRIAVDNPLAASAQVGKIRHVITQLATFPYLSRVGAVAGTRERVVPTTNHIVVFELLSSPATVIITAIVHGAQRR